MANKINPRHVVNAETTISNVRVLGRLDYTVIDLKFTITIPGDAKGKVSLDEAVDAIDDLIDRKRQEAPAESPDPRRPRRVLLGEE